ncbi:MAG: epimerase [Pseudonocardiales bacterium]|nr:epimerase [Pseudonocardiales bacterium]
MRVVIVGATGNLGSALARRLSAAGGHELVAVSRRRPADAMAASFSAWHGIDVGSIGAERTLVEAFAGAQAVVNFAWGFQPTRRPDVLERTGVTGSAQVLAAAAASGVEHLVHTSSVGAYAERQNLEPVDESFPVTGISGSVYSAHKVAAERHLDAWERENPGRLVISRLRPGFVVQRDAGAALFRYGLPGWLPGRALSLLPFLPLDRSFVIPVVHADDVADAVARLLDRRLPGPFNVAAERSVTRDELGQILHARPVGVSPGVLRSVVQATWRAQVQPLDGGWIRLAYAVPLLDSSRARSGLDWVAAHDPVEAMSEAIDGMRRGTGAGGPVLRHRQYFGELGRLVRSGPISRRSQP